jgi:hypothetical protein
MLLLSGCVFGQAKDGIVVYKKTHQPAATISLPYEPEVITAAMDDYFSQQGSKSNELKGFKTFQNTPFIGGDSIDADLYFKVSRKSKIEKDASIIDLMVGMPNEDIAARNHETHFTRQQAKEFLNKLASVVQAYNLELLIKQQNATVIKAEKRYNSLVDDGANLNKRENANAQKLQSNKHDQDKQNAEVEKQRQALALLVRQRKT